MPFYANKQFFTKRMDYLREQKWQKRCDSGTRGVEEEEQGECVHSCGNYQRRHVASQGNMSRFLCRCIRIARFPRKILSCSLLCCLTLSLMIKSIEIVNPIYSRFSPSLSFRALQNADSPAKSLHKSPSRGEISDELPELLFWARNL